MPNYSSQTMTGSLDANIANLSGGNSIADMPAMPTMDTSVTIPQVPTMSNSMGGLSISDMNISQPSQSIADISNPVQSSNPLSYNTHTHGEQLFTPDVATISGNQNSHGIDLLMTDNNVQFDHYVDPKLAAAAYDQDHAIIQHNDEVYLAPIGHVNPDAVELSCNMPTMDCALVMDDGDDSNNIHI